MSSGSIMLRRSTEVCVLAGHRHARPCCRARRAPSSRRSPRLPVSSSVTNSRGYQCACASMTGTLYPRLPRTSCPAQPAVSAAAPASARNSRRLIVMALPPDVQNPGALLTSGALNYLWPGEARLYCKAPRRSSLHGRDQRGRYFPTRGPMLICRLHPPRNRP